MYELKTYGIATITIVSALITLLSIFMRCGCTSAPTTSDHSTIVTSPPSHDTIIVQTPSAAVPLQNQMPMPNQNPTGSFYPYLKSNFESGPPVPTHYSSIADDKPRSPGQLVAMQTEANMNVPATMV